MRYLVIICIVFTTFVAQAQNEANNWFFGSKVGLKFDGFTKPVAQYGELNTLEGCASISDSSGNLLFYSDGSTVWSRNHQIMPNGTGLLGDESSTQSAIIVPHPTQSHLFYLFTVGSTQIPTGYHYYTIDMTLNNGFGDVTGASVDLSGDDNGFDWSEKITAVYGNTCNTVWVISLVRNKFYAYKIDGNGVSLTPVISEVNFTASRLSRGYLKASPNGKKIVAAHQGINGSDNGLYLYDFNNDTGEVIENNITLFDRNTQVYGIEFSSKTNKLYASTINNEQYKLYQFDLTAASIKNSGIIIHQEQPAFRGALQLGPDLKIYVTIPETYLIGSNYIDVINYPELDGVLCDFEEDYIFFGADNYVMQGLPPFIQSFFYENEINIVNPNEEVSVTSSDLELCLGDSYTLEGEDIQGAIYQWSYSDGNVVVNLPTPTPAHQLTVNTLGDNTPGTYTLKITTNDECNTLLIGKADVSFTAPPTVNSPTFLTTCDTFDNDSSDGLTTFNLEESITDLITGFAADYEVYFYLNDNDATTDILNENSLPVFYYNTTPNQILTAKVYRKNSDCYVLGQLQLGANSGQNLNAIDVQGCSETNMALFDLDAQIESIRSLNGLPNNVDIQFFSSLEDAILKSNTVNGNYESSDNLLYFYASQNGICYGSGSFNLTTNPLPPIDSQEETLKLCENEFPIIIESSIPNNETNNYNYLWSSGEISNSKLIYFPQTISVNVIDRNTLCEITKTYIIERLFAPSVTGIEINVNSGTVTVLTSDNLNNTYALNDINGAYQETNVFYNVQPGEHTLYVQNSNNCEISEREFYVLGFPRFFTPNNDSHNDHWGIKGLDSDKYTVSDVNIFDRYGKLLIVLSPESKWDGTYNGEVLPVSDYWFYVTIEDKEGNSKIYKGNFSIVR